MPVPDEHGNFLMDNEIRYYEQLAPDDGFRGQYRDEVLHELEILDNSIE